MILYCNIQENMLFKADKEYLKHRQIVRQEMLLEVKY